MSMAQSNVLRIGLGALLGVGLLTVLRPWTIEPARKSATAAFDAPSYVASSWSRVLREAEETAVDVANALRHPATDQGHVDAPRTRTAVFVKGVGVVTEVNLQSRVGQALVRLDGGVPPATVTIQVGPVLRGTALRDALSFVRFTDFANQFDFAAVANALNDRVLGTVLGPIEVRGLSGRRLSFIGAAVRDTRGAATIEIVPVSLTVAGRGGR